MSGTSGVKDLQMGLKRICFAFLVWSILYYVAAGEQTAHVGVLSQLPVPSRVYIAEGLELNLWTDNLLPAGTRDVHVSVESEVGETTERGFRFVPESRHVKHSFPSIIRVQDSQGRLIHSRPFIIHVAPARSGDGSLQLLFLGDSLTAGVPFECSGMISGEVKRLIEAGGGFRPLMLGTRLLKGNNRHEGWGGWSFRSFASYGASFHRFTVKGIQIKPSAGCGYQVAGLKYRVQNSNLVAGVDGKLAGTMMCLVRPKDNPLLSRKDWPKPEPSGIMTLYDRAGMRYSGITPDTEISFTKSEFPVSANPLWDETLNGGKGGMNVRQYMENYHFFGGADRIDFAFIQLGVNDCMGVAFAPEEETEKRLDEILLHCKNLVKGLQDPVSGYSGCRVIMALTPIGCNTPEAFKGVSMMRYESAVHGLWERILREFDGSASWPLVRISINGLMTDRDNGFPKKETTDGDKKIMLHSNAVHPGEVGYRQCAEAYYSVLRAWLEKPSADTWEGKTTNREY